MGKRSKRGIPEERIEKVGLHGLRRQYGPATDLDRAAPRAGNASRVTGRERGAGNRSLTGSTTGPAMLPE